MGIGESILIKAIAGATGRKPQQVKSDNVEKGDLGLVAEVCGGIAGLHMVNWGLGYS